MCLQPGTIPLCVEFHLDFQAAAAPPAAAVRTNEDTGTRDRIYEIPARPTIRAFARNTVLSLLVLCPPERGTRILFLRRGSNPNFLPPIRKQLVRLAAFWPVRECRQPCRTGCVLRPAQSSQPHRAVLAPVRRRPAHLRDGYPPVGYCSLGTWLALRRSEIM